MNAKEYLSQAFYLDQRINSKLELLANMKEMATRTTRVMQDDIVKQSRNDHAFENTIVKIVDMQNEINADIDRLVDKKQEIMRTIYAVANPEYQVLLESRYICYQNWEDIAEQMHCTVSNVYKMHVKALNSVIVPETD